MPSSADDAVIAASGTYAVTLNTSPTVSSLTLGGASGQQTLTTTSYTLTLTNASAINVNGVFNLNGGSLTATSPLTVHGLFNWYSASIMAGSVVTVATDGRLVLTSGSQHVLYGVITNAGTIQLLNGGGDLALYDSSGTGRGNFINLPGALVDVQGDNFIDSSVGTDLVINQGVLRKCRGHRHHLHPTRVQQQRHAGCPDRHGQPELRPRRWVVSAGSGCDADFSQNLRSGQRPHGGGHESPERRHVHVEWQHQWLQCFVERRQPAGQQNGDQQRADLEQRLYQCGQRRDGGHQRTADADGRHRAST